MYQTPLTRRRFINRILRDIDPLAVCISESTLQFSGRYHRYRLEFTRKRVIVVHENREALSYLSETLEWTPEALDIISVLVTKR